ncbi:hypothetical protein ANCCEY_03099 [Ancylostoma ceylanicum]|uniref:Uncharacterized protein n=1 Tax=Ancylostoma ceylanicum TaxID=53326 RepID=A0A0D6M5Z9_9BILA|nr:hypothetical protein ANCCEY_03099 [Ancylostoma ceylanicum]
MESLSTNMKNISGLIGELSGVLGGGREGVAQLGSSYKVVKSLQSIFELPGILQLIKLIDRSTEDVEGVAEAIGLLMKLEKSPKEVRASHLTSWMVTVDDWISVSSDPSTALEIVGGLFTERFETAAEQSTNLLLFIASDVTFSTLPPADFQAEFAHSVHEEIVIGAFKDMTSVAETYGSSEGEARYANPLMMLLLAFTLHHLANKSSQYLLSLCREQFSLTTSKTTVGLTGNRELFWFSN